MGDDDVAARLAAAVADVADVERDPGTEPNWVRHRGPSKSPTAAEGRADLAAAREAMASEEHRIPHSEVLTEYGIAMIHGSLTIRRSVLSVNSTWW